MIGPIIILLYPSILHHLVRHSLPPTSELMLLRSEPPSPLLNLASIVATPFRVLLFALSAIQMQMPDLVPFTHFVPVTTVNPSLFVVAASVDLRAFVAFAWLVLLQKLS